MKRSKRGKDKYKISHLAVEYRYRQYKNDKSLILECIWGMENRGERKLAKRNRNIMVEGCKIFGGRLDKFLYQGVGGEFLYHYHKFNTISTS